MRVLKMSCHKWRQGRVRRDLQDCKGGLSAQRMILRYPWVTLCRLMGLSLFPYNFHIYSIDLCVKKHLGSSLKLLGFAPTANHYSPSESPGGLANTYFWVLLPECLIQEVWDGPENEDRFLKSSHVMLQRVVGCPQLENHWPPDFHSVGLHRAPGGYDTALLKPVLWETWPWDFGEFWWGHSKSANIVLGELKESP